MLAARWMTLLQTYVPAARRTCMPVFAVALRMALTVRCLQTKKLHSGLPRSGDLRTFIESINRGLPTDSRTGSGQSSIKVADITMEDLSSLHRRLIAARARLKRCEYRWAELVKQSVEADVVKTGRAPVSTSQADELSTCNCRYAIAVQLEQIRFRQTGADGGVRVGARRMEMEVDPGSPDVHDPFCHRRDHIMLSYLV